VTARARTETLIAVVTAAGIVQLPTAAIVVALPTMPASMSLLTNVFTGERRGFAIGMWGAATELVSGIGVLVDGVLTGELSWRWIFAVNIAFTLLLVAVREAFVSALGTSLKISAALVAVGIVLAVALLRRSEPADAKCTDELIASVTPRPAPRGAKVGA
jgi:MFS family permease